MAMSIDAMVRDDEAVGAAEALGRLPGVMSVCVIGSGARAESDQTSDIDLFALVEDASARAAVRAAFERERGGRRIQVKLLTEAAASRLFARRSTFAVHVLREAVVIVDPGRAFAGLTERHSLEAPVRDNREDLLVRLEPYDELEWCQGFYLFCLSDLYAIGRAAAYTILGRQSRFEFSGVRALQAVGRVRPEISDAAGQIRELRPFFVLAHRNKREPLPFSYRGCDEAARNARDACVSLVCAIR